MSELSIQERYFADTVCFGCGPKNEKGLRIRSLAAPDGDGVVATWEPQPHHVSAPGVLNGGIVGALLDCHSVAAVYAETDGPGDLADGWWATAEYSVKLVRPTPTDAPLELHARVVELTGHRSANRSTTGVRRQAARHLHGPLPPVRAPADPNPRPGPRFWPYAGKNCARAPSLNASGSIEKSPENGKLRSRRTTSEKPMSTATAIALIAW